MSDPLIQTFCCHLNHYAVPVITHFNSISYNIICLVSSIAGIAGALYQMLPRHETWLSQQWFSLASLRGRQIIIWLALADLFASLGVFLRSTAKLTDSAALMDTESTSAIIYCSIIAMWTQYFYTVSWCWTLCYAADTWLAVQRRAGYPKVYHCISWLLPLFLQAFTYLSSHGGCGRPESSQMISYSVVVTVMLVSPILYFLALRHLHALAISCLGQLTNKERSVVRIVRLRFGLIVVSFYVCWLPNVIHGLLVTTWTLCPPVVLITIWYLMGILNPLQALFNSAVYRRPNLKLMMPFRAPQGEFNETTPLIQSNINT